MKILCGLGNPGSRYDGTRHNAGFIFIDEYAKKYDFPEFEEKWSGLVSEKGLGDEKVLLLKPLSFMNKSGEVLAKFMTFYKVDNRDVTVIYDDVDLPLGETRFRKEGSAGTHNGMKSVIGCLGSTKFPRLRLGIETRGESTPEQMDISDFVLAPFTDEERDEINSVIAEALVEIPLA